MKAAWLTIEEMEKAIATGDYTNCDGEKVHLLPHMCKQVAQRIAQASKEKAASLA